jgi:hypothetical protein
MKLETDKKIGFDSNMGFDGVDASISADDMHKLWDILQDPYKNSIGAVVREYVSNSFDSHAEANFIKHNDLTAIRNEYSVYNTVPDEEIIELKKHLQVFNDDAVAVSINTDSSGVYWTTEDFGVGLSPSRVVNVFANYLKSTKENSNNVIGAFGIGSKSGLSYTDIVFIRTRYNGKEYEYWLRKGEKGPRLEFVSEIPTTERNGTQIKIYIKIVSGPYSWSTPMPETLRFEEECKKQLAYFDNVYFSGISIQNDYKLFEGTHWVKNSSIAPFAGLHLCLGKVAYPIDFGVLGIDAISFPVALKFDIGELDVIQTREDVRYNPKTKTAILNKIELLKEEFQTRWNSIQLETSDLQIYLKNKDKIPAIELDSHNTLLLEQLFPPKYLKAWRFIPFDKINFKCPILENLFFEYNVSYRMTSQRLVPNSFGMGFGKFLFEGTYTFYRIKENTTPLVTKYIVQELEGSRDCYLIRKTKHISLYAYKKFLKLDDYPKSEWRTIITTYQKEIQRLLIKVTKSYDKVVVPKEWGAKDKNRVAIDRTLYNVNVQQLHHGYNLYYTQLSYKWNKATVLHSKKQYLIDSVTNKESLNDVTTLYYAALQYRFKLGKLRRNPIERGGQIMAATVAPTNLKHFENMKNVTTVESFLNKKNLIFRQTMTAIRLSKNAKLMQLLRSSRDLSNVWENVYSPIAKELIFLNKYIGMASDINKDSKFVESCYSIAEEHNSWEFDVLNRAENLLKYFEGLDLILYLSNLSITPVEHIVHYIRNYNKSNRVSLRKKLNPNYYVNFNALEVEALASFKDGSMEKITSNYVKLLSN